MGNLRRYDILYFSEKSVNHCKSNRIQLRCISSSNFSPLEAGLPQPFHDCIYQIAKAYFGYENQDKLFGNDLQCEQSEQDVTTCLFSSLVHFNHKYLRIYMKIYPISLSLLLFMILHFNTHLTHRCVRCAFKSKYMMSIEKYNNNTYFVQL